MHSTIIHEAFIKVAIVDDHKIVTDSLCEILEKEDDICVVDKAYSMAGCRTMLERSQPDVLLLDVNLSDGNGIDLCQEIRNRYPDIKILMLTSYAETNVIGRALDGGAHGYVLKNSSSEELIKGILTVFEGERFLCDQARVLYRKQIFQPVTLTPREREILKLIVDGLTIKEIADRLFLGFETVRSYNKYLHLKLDVHNTAQLVRKAMEEMLV